MKFFSLALLISILGCTSVQPIDPPNEFTNKLQINGVESEIVLAEMVRFEKLPANQNYKFQLLLHTGTTKALYQPEWNYSGVGSYFNFTLWSEDPNIGSGTYTVDGFVENNFSITRASTALNINWETGENDFFSFLEGSVDIKNNGTTYELTINCFDFDGNPVTAFYEGGFVEVTN